MPAMRHEATQETVTDANNQIYGGNNRVEPSWRINIISSVRALKTFFVLLLLGTWFPCTVRCSMEMMASVEPLACCDNSKVGNDSSQTPASSEQCVCTWMRSGGYAFQKCAPLNAPEDVLLLFTLSPHIEESPTDPALPKFVFSPPELSTSWQFYFRTASPPRAPSIAS